MPVYAAMTPTGDPPEYEFVPYQSNLKYPKIKGGILIFKFASMALLTRAKQIAYNKRGFNLHRVTRKDFGTHYQPVECNDLNNFTASLAISGWCEPCGRFTYGRMSEGKCIRCDRRTL